ncbi:MAG: molybdopterin molybdotransferase MoeA [Demequinaceae bacterium]|nr:molybdopterin molybdotransferase MoeA [Demequinaceae bacterium]
MEKLTLAQYRAALLEGIERIPAIEVLVADSAGSILAEDLVSEGPIPPVAVATCDGYAVAAADVAKATAATPISLAVSHDVAWEARGPRRHVPRTAARIVSGAPIPINADTVVPIGATDGGVAKVAITAASRQGANVREQGTDASAGQVLVPAGTRLGARQLGLAAAMGRRRLSVHPTPRVVILSVGNELGDPSSRLRSAGVPESNSHTLSVMVAEAGARAYRVGAVGDDRMALRTTIEDQLVRADLLLTTGGLSGAVGDTLPEVLAELGAFEVVPVAMMPGRRHGHGAISSGGQGPSTPVIALPGHPAAAVIAFEMYVRPVLRTMSAYAEKERPRFKARATKAWESPSGVVQCVPVQIEHPRTRDAQATPIGHPWQPSLVDLARANGLAVIPEETTKVAVGDPVVCLIWDD